MRSAMIAAHNQARSEYGVAPLVWDEGLARDARTYARFLARTAKFEHDPQRGRRSRQGENLWMGTRTAYSYAQMIGHLVGERRFYQPGRFPDVSRTGEWSHVAHYTQIIWPTSQQVGCATASNRSDDYLVCRYFPAGNIVGVTMR
jgi:Cysteine-rich secretory protein family